MSENEYVADVLRIYRKKYRGHVKTLRLLEMDWPCAHSVVEKVIERFGMDMEVARSPVSFRAINQGLDRYQENLSRCDPERLNCFIEGVVNSLVNDFENQSVQIQDKGEVWSVLSDESLLEFVERSNRASLVTIKSEHNRESVGQHLTKCLVTHSLWPVVEEYNKWAR